LPDLPNVLIVVLDTVRRDVVTPYTDEAVTPYLASLAEEAVVLSNAFTTSDWTLPAHASMLTGQYASRHGVNYNTGYGNLRGRPNLATRLAKAGYRTLGISNNPWFSAMTALDEGFETFRLLRPRERRVWIPLNFFKDRVYENFARAPMDPWKRMLLTYEWVVKGRVDDGCAQAFGELLRLLDAGDGGPWFAMVNVVEAHSHFIPPQPFRDRFTGDVPTGRLLAINQDAYNYHFGVTPMTEADFAHLRGLYKGEVAYLDHMLEGLLDALRKRAAYDDTLIIITSDHGENLGEHGLMEHRWCVYDTLLRIPMIVKPPEGHRQDMRGLDPTGLVDLTDIYPTLARFADITIPSSDAIQGVDMLEGGRKDVLAEMVPRQLPEGRLPREAWERFEPMKVSLRTREEKVIWSSDGHHERYLYGEGDAGEERDVFDTSDQMTEGLLGRLRGLSDLEALAEQRTSGELRVDDRDLRDRLRALGYMS
jgi:arylsulfatase A-like enzyme